MKNAIDQANEILRMLKKDRAVNQRFRDKLEMMVFDLQQTLDEPIFKKGE